MANVRCPACALTNPDTYAKCRRCGAELTATGEGIWRDGQVLVLRKGVPLPDRCVRCNQAAGGSGFQGNFYWHPPGYYVIAPFALLIYAIVAMVVRKNAKVFVVLCPEHTSRRRWARIGSALLALVGFICLFAAIENGAVFGWSGLTMVLAAAIWGGLGSRALAPVRIDDTFARFKGAGDAYLAQLPSWAAYS